MVREFSSHRELLLVLDSSAEIRSLVREVVGSDFAVAEAGDGLEAIAVARELRPRVAVIDHHAPFVSGVDVAAEIRGIVDHCILMSSTWLTAEELIRAGNPSVLPKPFRIAALRKAVGVPSVATVR
ncbi:unannotated protein [freshwater metagenome]|uniref:Unannotated protein n=1 Tax=freshwater metagenome TaxID=449393 RepID=A0A6J6NSQ2_9ZZZZ